MNKKLIFRAWYYFRTGWATYFTFLFASVNTLVVTYYLAIEKIPGLQVIFPSFFTYVAIVTSAGIPLLVLAGYIHFKKIPTYTSELDIGAESNQWIFKLQPGYMLKVTYPMHRMMTIMMLKLLNNEKLNDEELTEIKKILKDLDTLIAGGYISKPKNMR